MTKAELGKMLGVKLVEEPIKKCWFIRDRDWSNYTTIKGLAAHRVSYSATIGPLKVGMEICHRCDRPGCINPKHLFQGTHSDNIQDARKKHRIFNIRVVPKLHNITKEERDWARMKHLRRLVGS